MGARPSSFKKGGGYLNNVDAEIIGYQFVVGETAKIKKGNRKGEDFTPLSLVPEFKVDGADQPLTQRLLIGDSDDFGGEVSEDGLTIETPEGQAFNASSEAGIFLASLCEAGFPESNFEDTNERINLEPMIGTRVRLVQEINVEKTKRQGQQKGKDGKLYDRKDLKVAEVLGVATMKSKSAATKTVAAKSVSKSNGKASVSVEDLADETLMAILSDTKTGSLNRRLIAAKAHMKLGPKHPQGDEVRRLIYSEDYLNAAAERGLITYEQSGKDQTISLA
jgi:hypothetical protein